MAAERKPMPDRVVTGAPGGPVDFWIYSESPKHQWRPRVQGSLTRSDHPGSAIKYGDKLYELMAGEETVQWGYNIRYGLREWDSSNVVRAPVSYTPEAEAAAAASQREETEKLQLRHRILWLFPLAGLAPASLQNKWAVLTGLKMAWISAGSALFFLVLALFLREESEHTLFFGLVIYLAAESFARFLLTAMLRRPFGAAWVTIPYHLWQTLARRQAGTSRETASALPPIMQDEVIRRPGESSLTVRSPFYDTDLAGATPVRFEGAFYQPLPWRREGKGLQRRWLYELEKIEAAPAGRWREFISPRTPARQKAVEEYTHRFDLAQSFALFWGIYPHSEQARLHLLYEYEGARSTAISAGMFLAVGILQIAVTAAYHAPAFTIAGPAYLILESAYRLYRAKVLHEPAGSIVGYIFHLAIRPPK